MRRLLCWLGWHRWTPYVAMGDYRTALSEKLHPVHARSCRVCHKLEFSE